MTEQRNLNGIDIDDLENIRDPLDIYALLSRVHSEFGDVNKDFTLAWTDQALEDWVTRQLELANDLHDLIAPINLIEAKNQKAILVSEIIMRIIFTRSRDGRVLQAGLAYNKKDVDFFKEEQAKTTMEKLTTPIKTEETKI